MSKQKIAVLIDWYLPGTKAGGPVRSVYSLVNLLKDEFDFYIITTNFDLGSSTPYKDIKANELFLQDQIHYYYFSKENLNSKNMLSLIKEIKPQLIYLNSFWSFWFSINLVKLKQKNLLSVPVLLAPRGMLSKGAMSLKSLKKNLFLLLAKILRRYNNIPFHATNEQEANDIRKQFSSAKVLIAPNVNSSSLIENKTVKAKNHLKLFFLSRIAEVKNLHYALEILKAVPSEITVEYDIYGNLEDTDYWKKCEEIISQLPKNVSVRQKGELKFNEVQSVICNYHVLFLPTLNENFGHSIVESLLCGCPAIISDQTPWNDLEKHNAGFAISLNNTKDFVQAILHFANMNQQEFLQASKAANNYIREKIDLEKIKQHYKTLFYDAIQN